MKLCIENTKCDFLVSFPFLFTLDNEWLIGLSLSAQPLIGYILVSTVEQSTERQREGIAIAKQKGKYKGKPVNVELSERIRALAEEGTNKMQIAKQLSCSRTTVYKALSS